jgi:hypothetical protein
VLDGHQQLPKSEAAQCFPRGLSLPGPRHASVLLLFHDAYQFSLVPERSTARVKTETRSRPCVFSCSLPSMNVQVSRQYFKYVGIQLPAPKGGEAVSSRLCACKQYLKPLNSIYSSCCRRSTNIYHVRNSPATLFTV